MIAFCFVHLSTPLDVCKERDASGLYERHQDGLHASIPGVTQPYESPNDADLKIDTSMTSTTDAGEQVISLLKSHNIID